MKIPRRRTNKARIEIIPMIDTIFFLLVFFMIASLSMTRVKGLDVALPRPATVESPESPKVVITKTVNGVLLIGSVPISDTELGPRLQTIVNSHPDTLLVLNVDHNQPMQSLVNVMDIVNSIKTPAGEPAAVSIAEIPVDANGNAVVAKAVKTARNKSSSPPVVFTPLH